MHYKTINGYSGKKILKIITRIEIKKKNDETNVTKTY